MNLSIYHYKAIIRSVYDGDTCKADIDLGLKSWVHGQKLRLARIDTPEIRGESHDEGIKVRDFVRSKILDQEVFIQTVKDRTGKYGRYLAEIWVIENDGSIINLNDLLLDMNFAIRYGETAIS